MLKFDCIFLTFSKNSSLYIHDIHQILTCQKHTQNRTRTLKRRDKPLFVFWPFLVQFRLILGLNNFKFVHKSIFAVYTSIWSNQLDWINLIGSTWLDQLDWINLIGSTQLNQIESNRLQKWICRQILSCLDLNWVQIGPKMALWRSEAEMY